ncbi:MAG: hypothetical protein ACE369_11360 [Roseovarius sp.]
MEGLIHSPGPPLAALLLLALATMLGMAQVARIIKVYEARHELKHGSAGFIRSVSGWSLVVFWAMAVWFVATVIGDWWATEDLAGAVDRAWLRLRILLEIAAALGDSD